MLVYVAQNFTMINKEGLEGETAHTSEWTHSSLWLLLKNIDNKKQFLKAHSQETGWVFFASNKLHF